MQIILNKISNSELHQKLHSLIAEERRITHEVLQHICEVDTRKLYLQMAYPSLFEYLVKAHGYSESSAQRRIDSARLMAQIPAAKLGQKIESGAISLNQVSKIQQALRSVKKTTGISVSSNVKSQILTRVENKSLRETERILMEEFICACFAQLIINLDMRNKPERSSFNFYRKGH